MLKVVLPVLHLAYCFWFKDLHLFRSQFLNLLRSTALMLFTLKNFQGCIVVYLSRFKPALRAACVASATLIE